MPLALIDIISVSEKVKEEVKQELTWYDHEAKWLITASGGQWEHRYDAKTKRMKVGIAKVEAISYKSVSNKNRILEWFQKESHRLIMSIVDDDGRTMSVSFSKDQRKLIEESLYEWRFSFEIADA